MLASSSSRKIHKPRIILFIYLRHNREIVNKNNQKYLFHPKFINKLYFSLFNLLKFAQNSQSLFKQSKMETTEEHQQQTAAADTMTASDSPPTKRQREDNEEEAREEGELEDSKEEQAIETAKSNAIKTNISNGNQKQLSKCVKEPTITYRPPFDSTHRVQRLGGKYHVLLAVTGSVAAIKTGELIQELYRQSPPNKLTIKVIATPCALNFFNPEELAGTVVYDDRDEWNMWKKRGDPILHIELRKWADSLLIAPLDANTMAKVANGICDNLVTSAIRAWDPQKPLYFAPAMNTAMWENALTYQHLKTLKELLQYREIPPIEKELMCGDKGYGAMASLQMIGSIISADVRNKFAVYSYSPAD